MRETFSALSNESRSRFTYDPSEERELYKRSRQPLSKRSSVWYFEEPLISAKVQDTLYRVHKDTLRRESLRIRAYIEQTSGWLRPPGQTDANPLELDTDAEQFEAFLSFIYEREDEAQRRSVQFYVDLLSFAISYGCPRIVEIALEGVQDRSMQLVPVQRLLLGKTHNLLALQRSAYTSLCIRSTFLSDEEAEQLDKDDLVLIARAQLRITLEEKSMGGAERTFDRPFWDMVGRIVEEIFFCGGQKHDEEEEIEGHFVDLWSFDQESSKGTTPWFDVLPQDAIVVNQFDVDDEVVDDVTT